MCRRRARTSISNNPCWHTAARESPAVRLPSRWSWVPSHTSAGLKHWLGLTDRLSLNWAPGHIPNTPKCLDSDPYHTRQDIEGYQYFFLCQFSDTPAYLVRLFDSHDAVVWLSRIWLSAFCIIYLFEDTRLSPSPRKIVQCFSHINLFGSQVYSCLVLMLRLLKQKQLEIARDQYHT